MCVSVSVRASLQSWRRMETGNVMGGAREVQIDGWGQSKMEAGKIGVEISFLVL